MPPTTAPTTTTLSDADFAVPIEDRCFEDYVPGAVHVYGSITMAEEDILRFAREFDPQGVHIDPQAALQGPYQGLIASGRHTSPVMTRLRRPLHQQGGRLASPGIDELRRVRPVRPGDSLSLGTTVRESRRPSRSKPDRGLVHTGIEVLNQHGEPVPTMTAVNFLLRRTAA